MRVIFRDNLGSRDAEKHSLDFRECGRGAEREVSTTVGRSLIARGFASEVPAHAEESPAVVQLPTEIRAVPDTPEIGESNGPEIKAETKSARGAAKKSHPPQKDDQ